MEPPVAAIYGSQILSESGYHRSKAKEPIAIADNFRSGFAPYVQIPAARPSPDRPRPARANRTLPACPAAPPAPASTRRRESFLPESSYTTPAAPHTTLLSRPPPNSKPTPALSLFSRCASRAPSRVGTQPFRPRASTP